jgi:hypothetical protein
MMNTPLLLNGMLKLGEAVSNQVPVRDYAVSTAG